MASTTLKRRTRHISLDFLGDEWVGCGIEMKRPTYLDAEAVDELTADLKGMKGLIATMKYFFVSGTGVNEDGDVIDLTTDNFDQFDSEALFGMSNQLVPAGEIDPKAETTSTPGSADEVPSLSDSADSSTGNDSASAPTS